MNGFKPSTAKETDAATALQAGKGAVRVTRRHALVALLPSALLSHSFARESHRLFSSRPSASFLLPVPEPTTEHRVTALELVSEYLDDGMADKLRAEFNLDMQKDSNAAQTKKRSRDELEGSSSTAPPQPPSTNVWAQKSDADEMQALAYGSMGKVRVVWSSESSLGGSLPRFSQHYYTPILLLSEAQISRGRCLEEIRLAEETGQSECPRCLLILPRRVRTLRIDHHTPCLLQVNKKGMKSMASFFGAAKPKATSKKLKK